MAECTSASMQIAAQPTKSAIPQAPASFKAGVHHACSKGNIFPRVRFCTSMRWHSGLGTGRGHGCLSGLPSGGCPLAGSDRVLFVEADGRMLFVCLCQNLLCTLFAFDSIMSINAIRHPLQCRRIMLCLGPVLAACQAGSPWIAEVAGTRCYGDCHCQNQRSHDLPREAGILARDGVSYIIWGLYIGFLFRF